MPHDHPTQQSPGPRPIEQRNSTLSTSRVASAASLVAIAVPYVVLQNREMVVQCCRVSVQRHDGHRGRHDGGQGECCGCPSSASFKTPAHHDSTHDMDDDYHAQLKHK